MCSMRCMYAFGSSCKSLQLIPRNAVQGAWLRRVPGAHASAMLAGGVWQLSCCLRRLHVYRTELTCAAISPRTSPLKSSRVRPAGFEAEVSGVQLEAVERGKRAELCRDVQHATGGKQLSRPERFQGGKPLCGLYEDGQLELLQGCRRGSKHG